MKSGLDSWLAPPLAPAISVDLAAMVAAMLPLLGAEDDDEAAAAALAAVGSAPCLGWSNRLRSFCSRMTRSRTSSIFLNLPTRPSAIVLRSRATCS